MMQPFDIYYMIFANELKQNLINPTAAKKPLNLLYNIHFLSDRKF